MLQDKNSKLKVQLQFEINELKMLQNEKKSLHEESAEYDKPLELVMQ